MKMDKIHRLKQQITVKKKERERAGIPLLALMRKKPSGVTGL
jgi:hypothetical protein